MDYNKLMKTKPNYAFIDSQNLHLGVSGNVVNKRGELVYKGKKLDFKKFRDYLRQKYNVQQAYLFIGMLPGNSTLYSHLQQAGYTIIFKQIAWHFGPKGEIVVKGNVDTDIVLYAAAKLVKKYESAIFVSGDGDFLSLYQHMEEIGKLSYIFIPNRHSYSRLLNQYRNKLRFVSDLLPLFHQQTTNKINKPNKKTRSGVRTKSLDLPGHGDVSNIPHGGQNIKG